MPQKIFIVSFPRHAPRYTPEIGRLNPTGRVANELVNVQYANPNTERRWSVYISGSQGLKQRLGENWDSCLYSWLIKLSDEYIRFWFNVCRRSNIEIL